MLIKRYISIWNPKTILDGLFRMPGFSGWSKGLLTICLLGATIQIWTPPLVDDLFTTIVEWCQTWKTTENNDTHGKSS